MVRPGPGCAVWEITLRCNLNCIHCGSAAGKARSNELSTEEAIDLCHQLKGIRCSGVAMMGGEPLTRSDWPEIASTIQDLGMDLSLITNGYSIPESTFNKIERINPELVTVSLDGGTPEIHDRIRGVSGSFDYAVQTIERFVSMDLPTGVITTVHKMNLRELKAIRELLLGKGIAWQIQMATPFGRLTPEYVLSKEEFYSVAMFIASSQQNYSKAKLMVAGAHDMGYFSDFLPPIQVVPWQGCQAGISTIGIQSDGAIRGCLSLSERFNEGNIRETPLVDIWNAPNFSSYSRNVINSNLGGACSKCEYGTICKGGCSGVSFSLTGGFHRDPYCLKRIENDIGLHDNAS
ncbi:MAG: radical SAM protein [Candidatus Thorarchaeota archaeon]|nr:radical SAM protein [Candidatus Thorarchaeota archaeon]